MFCIALPAITILHALLWLEVSHQLHRSYPIASFYPPLHAIVPINRLQDVKSAISLHTLKIKLTITHDCLESLFVYLFTLLLLDFQSYAF